MSKPLVIHGERLGVSDVLAVIDSPVLLLRAESVGRIAVPGPEGVASSVILKLRTSHILLSAEAAGRSVLLVSASRHLRPARPSIMIPYLIPSSCFNRLVLTLIQIRRPFRHFWLSKDLCQMAPQVIKRCLNLSSG